VKVENTHRESARQHLAWRVAVPSRAIQGRRCGGSVHCRERYIRFCRTSDPDATYSKRVVRMEKSAATVPQQSTETVLYYRVRNPNRGRARLIDL